MTGPINLGDLVPAATLADKIALIDLLDAERPCEYRYRDMERMIRGVARFVAAQGFSRGSRIGILALNRAEYVAAYFGIMRAGLVAVPVNTKLPEAMIDYILGDAEVRLVFADAANAGRVGGGRPVVSFDDAGPHGFLQRLDDGPFSTFVPQLSDVAQQLYTSGSTGRPKGVPLTHESQLWALRQRTLGPGGKDERFIVAAPLFHMNGLFSTKMVFATGASLVLLPGFTPRGYIEAVARHRVTALTSVPTMIARVLKETDLLEKLDLSSVKRVTMGSAPMTMNLWRKVREAFPDAPINYTYGTTEAGPAIFGAHPRGLPMPPLSIGYPLADGEVKLVGGADDNEGVLWMRNPSVMAEYHNLPAQTAKALNDGWYISGDVMRRDPDGFFFFVGRADDMFICSGENIYPGEVEKMLEQHPGIHQTSVVPLADEERGQMPVAFVVRRPGAELDYAELRRFALANAPAYQHPRRVEFLDELPLAGTNKIDRRSLTLRAEANEAAKHWSP
jgi:acyl-CoA synthetase (AMP-forming)/AMP-acid ligase II